MHPATLTWGLIAAGIAFVVVAGLWWRGQRHRQQRRRAEAARLAAAATAQAQQAQQAQRAQQEAQRKAAAAAQAALDAERLRAEQTVRAQAEREAQQHARAETERAAAANAAQRAQAESQAVAAAEQAASTAAAHAAHAERLSEQHKAEEAAADALQAEARIATARLAQAAAATPRSPADTLVMVADDSKVVRVKTSRLLTQHGYRVVLAEDGAQAAELIETEVPAVLVTDVEMPGLDGFALTRHVRAHPRAGHIPIIMITSADERLKAAAAEAGVTLVLGKPYPEDELIACIERSQASVVAATA